MQYSIIHLRFSAIISTQIAVMLDTKGPEIRTGFFAEGKTISLKAGQDLELTTDYSVRTQHFCSRDGERPHANTNTNTTSPNKTPFQ